MTNNNPVPLKFDNMPMKAGFKVGDNLFVVSDNNDIFLTDIVTQKLEPVSVRIEGEFSKEFYNKGSRFFWENGYKAPIVINNSIAWQLVYTGTEFIAKEICNVVPTNALIRSLQYSDEKKILFIGTDSKGLVVITQHRVDAIKKKDPATDEKNSYYSQIELPGNAVLTSEGHVLGQKEISNIILPVKGKLSFNVYRSGDSLLWFSAKCSVPDNHCLYSYNYKSGKTIEHPKIVVGGNFGLAYSNGRLYLANDEGVALVQQDSLYYLSRSKKTTQPRFTVFDMIESSPGILSIASCSGLINYNTNTLAIDTLLSLPGYCVRTLWKYKDYLFLGTYGKGYYIYKSGRIKAMPLDKNNFLAYVHCFMPDRFGYCWISTNRGLFKSSLEELINAFENNSPAIYYHYIGRNDGMDITEMNGGCTPCALQMKNETISFPTMDGLLWVDPQKAIPILPEGEIFIDEINVDNKKIDPDSMAAKEFPAKTQEIAIQLGFSAWSNKENLYIEYQLNDTVNWKLVNADNDPVIRLYNLSPGSYKLRIRKLNGFGINNYTYKELRFTITTPWYRQGWFFVLVVLSVIGLVILFFKLRTRQYVTRQLKLEEQVFDKTRELQMKNEILEKNDAIKTRLISIISHDIITPLKFLTSAGKNLLEKRTMMSESLQDETIHEITNTSQELQLLSTNILNWIKYQNKNRLLTKETFNMHELVRQVLGILNTLAQQKNLHIINEVDSQASLYQYYEPMKILVYNLLTNAIHFSEKGIISVNMKQTNNYAIVIVKDEGIGMSQEKIQNLMADHVVISSANVDNKKGHGLGFLIIKDLLKTMGASLQIDSKLGEGTTISILIPAGANNK